MGRLGAACYRHRWLTVVVWVAGVACLITLWMRFGAAADNSFTGNDPGQSLLNEHFAAAVGGYAHAGHPLAGADHVPGGAGAGGAGPGAVPAGAARHRGDRPVHHAGALAADGHIAYATSSSTCQGSSIPGSEATALMHDATVASGNGVTFSLGGDVVDLAETPYGGRPTGSAWGRRRSCC